MNPESFTLPSWTRVVGGLLASGALWSAAAADARYAPTWDSLDRRPCPPWYLDAKFGIFIH